MARKKKEALKTEPLNIQLSDGLIEVVLLKDFSGNFNKFKFSVKSGEKISVNKECLKYLKGHRAID